MNERREQWMIDEYPEFFYYLGRDPDEIDEDPVPTIASYGITCGDGWDEIIRAVAKVIEETINNREDEPTVRAVQIKQKFGGLRIYTTHDGTVSQLTRMAEYLSFNMCEECGETATAQRRDTAGLMKTLCEACAMQEGDIQDPVPVYAFPYECFDCGSEIEVIYPRGIGGSHGGTWEVIGEDLAALEHGNIEQTFSEVQGTTVWGNICPDCDAYQGNYYVYQEATSIASEHGGWGRAEDLERVSEIPLDI